ncbi:MAG: tRNA-(ms[2]io[6]A)-hydroxylase [Steroidobacteraceae bacterium]
MTDSVSVPAAFAGTLSVSTPEAWFVHAAECWRELLIDHANCEKKAASTALSIIFTYPEDLELTERMSRLAREELRHFEQVQRLLRELHVPWQRMSPSRYAEGMRKNIRRNEPERLLDLLICGALIEARSCERFLGLAPRLDEPLQSFYAGLAASEARHHSLYLRLAERRYPNEWRATLAKLSAVEAELVATPDPQFRFHSGVPVALSAAS